MDINICQLQINIILFVTNGTLNGYYWMINQHTHTHTHIYIYKPI